MHSVRNMFTKRVMKTVTQFLKTQRFGLGNISKENKLDSLVDLVTSGINRCENKTLLTLPIFHAFSTRKEMSKNKLKFSQADLLSRCIKGHEFKEVNGKRIQDILMESDVAMIIAIIRNSMVSSISHLFLFMLGIFIFCMCH